MSIFQRIAIFLTIASASQADAQDIVENITRSGNCVYQSEALARLVRKVNIEELKAQTEAENTQSQQVRSSGWRIQVFSDSNQRSAKGEARAKSRNISSRFPQYRTYVTYNSPYWRLRVGDFKSQSEANEAADEIKQAFPSYAKEIRVVRDRIN